MSWLFVVKLDELTLGFLEVVSSFSSFSKHLKVSLTRSRLHYWCRAHIISKGYIEQEHKPYCNEEVNCDCNHVLDELDPLIMLGLVLLVNTGLVKDYIAILCLTAIIIVFVFINIGCYNI